MFLNGYSTGAGSGFSWIFRQTACRSSRLGGQREVLQLQPFGSFLDPNLGQCSFLLWTLLVAAVDTQSPRTLRVCHFAGLYHARLAPTSVDSKESTWVSRLAGGTIDFSHFFDLS